MGVYFASATDGFLSLSSSSYAGAKVQGAARSLSLRMVSGEAVVEIEGGTGALCVSGRRGENTGSTAGEVVEPLPFAGKFGNTGS